MERRKFLGMMVGGVAASAAVRTFPFRVFSFPRQIVELKKHWVFIPHTVGFSVGEEFPVYDHDGKPTEKVIRIKSFDRKFGLIHFEEVSPTPLNTAWLRPGQVLLSS